MQLKILVVVGRIGHGEAAPLAVLEKNVNVLAGEKLQALARWQLEVKDRDIFGGLLDLFHAAGQGADREVLCARELAHFENDVGQGARAAGERLAGGLLGGVKRALLVIAIRELAGAQNALARAAGAVATSVGQSNPLAQRGFQDGLARSDGESVAARLEPDLMAGRG